jgi:hypothetical protein
MTAVPLPLKLFLGWSGLAGLAGGIWGFVRGLQGGDTLIMQVVAPVEGAVIFAVPATFVGLVVLGLWYAVSLIARGASGGGPPRSR